MTVSTEWSSTMSYVFDKKGGIGVSWRHSSGRGLSIAPCFAHSDSAPSSSVSRKVVEGNSILIGSGNEEEEGRGGGGIGLVESLSMADWGRCNGREKVGEMN